MLRSESVLDAQNADVDCFRNFSTGFVIRLKAAGHKTTAVYVHEQGRDRGIFAAVDANPVLVLDGEIRDVKVMGLRSRVMRSILVLGGRLFGNCEHSK